MSYPFTINGEGLDSGTINLPLVGAWHADLECVADTAAKFPTGARVSIVLNDGLKLSGTAFRSGSAFNSSSVRVVGGAGGLGNNTRPRSYQGISFNLVLGDLLRDAGEKLSPKSDAGILNSQLRRWALIPQSTGTAIASLLLAVAPNASWRVLADGTVWVGNENWAPVSPSYSLLREFPDQARFQVGMDSLTLIPGTTFFGRHITYVQHAFDATSLTSLLWYNP